jgi:hypothetical protein
MQLPKRSSVAVLIVSVFAITAVVPASFKGIGRQEENTSMIQMDKFVHAEHTSTIAFVNVNVVPMTRDIVLADQTVVITDGRIAAIGPFESTIVPDDAVKIDGRGYYLLPGLTDFHVHIRAETELLSYLAFGVTTVVNLRGGSNHLAMRDRVRRGELLGPTIYTSGPRVDGDPPIWRDSNNRILTDPKEADEVVEAHLASGYNFIKVYNNLPPDAFAALVSAAKSRGIAVVGHVPRAGGRDTALDRVLRAGQAMIAHGEEYFFTHFRGASNADMKEGPPPEPDVSQIPEVAAATKMAGTAVTPNLVFPMMVLKQVEDLDGVLSDPETRHLDPAVRRLWETANPTRRNDLERFVARERVKYGFLKKLTRGLRDAGVRLLLGTDASGPGMFPGKSAHQELRELVDAGLTPYEALVTATCNAGEFIAVHVAGAEPFGTVTPGSRADLLLVDANPLTGVEAVARLAGVMVRGRWLSKTKLQAMRDSVAASYGK